MKKIVHLSSVHPARDIRIFHKECSSLARAGYDVTLIAVSDADTEENGVRTEHVRKAGGKFSRMTRTALSVLVKAWRKKADLYHFHDPELMPVAALLRLTGAKVIYDVHEDVPKQVLSKDWIHPALRLPVAYSIKAAEWLLAQFIFSGVVAATPSIAKNFPKRKTVLVENFPILGELSPQDNNVPISERPMNICYVGGITAIRGILQNIEAMGLVKAPEASLSLVGNFPEEAVRQQAQALDGWDKVDFMGFRSRQEVAGLLANARMGLVLFLPKPNHIEAQPNKMFEYMSAGLPVIASDFPLWRHLIEGSQCGLLADPEDPKAIAGAIDWILSHPEEAEEMGRCGQAAVQQHYNWNIAEKSLLELYQKQLA